MNCLNRFLCVVVSAHLNTEISCAELCSRIIITETSQVNNAVPRIDEDFVIQINWQQIVWTLGPCTSLSAFLTDLSLHLCCVSVSSLLIPIGMMRLFKSFSASFAASHSSSFSM